MNRNELFKELYRRCCNEFIELRAILKGRKPIQVFIPLNTAWDAIREQVDGFCEKNKDVHIYFGVATRDDKGGEKKNVKSVPCVWAEMDYKHFPEAPNSRVYEIIDKFSFKPTIVIKSGGGVYLIFLLDKPVDLKRSEDVVKVNDWIRLELNKLGECEFDKISDIPRILRLPGTVNHKYDHKPVCEVVEINDNSYKLDDFLKRIPAQNTKSTKRDETHKPSEQSTSTADRELKAQVEHVVKQVEEKKTILGDDSYSNWLSIAFALIDGLGEEGRSYFHRVSSLSNKYNKDDCDKQYDACLNGGKPDGKITISTFYYLARNADISIVTEVTEGTVSDKKIIPESLFPLEVFPERLRTTISNFGTALHVNPELVACSLLPIIGGALGNTIRISPKHKWEEPPFIWLNIIGKTGYGKTPVINAVIDPINKMQGKLHKEYEQEYIEYKEEVEEYKNLSKEDQKKTEAPHEPEHTHLIVSDFTIESLVDVFESTPRGVIAYKDELSGLILGLNQYKGNKGSDRQHILELFNAKSWKVDRKGTGSRYIPNTGASIIGGMPPNVMQKVFDQASFDDGFLPRFLPIHSGDKPPKFSRECIQTVDLEYWNNILESCYQIDLVKGGDDFVTPIILALDADTLDSFEAFYNEYMDISPLVSSRMQVFIPKLITYCLRFALSLHVLESFSEQKEVDRHVNKKTMDNAIKLTRFFAGQAIKAIDLYGDTKEKFNEYQKRLVRTLYSLKDEVKTARLPLSRIVELFNSDLPETLKHTSEAIKSLLTDLNIDTKKGTGHKSQLIWEPEKINILFTKITVLTVPTVTPNSLKVHKQERPRVKRKAC
jgi:hypothetical protein